MQIDWLTVAAQIVNFLVLVWLLQRFLYRPITNAMARREARIEERLADARARRRAAEDEAEQLRKQREELENSKDEMLEKARAEADDLKARLEQEAREEIDSKRENWRKALEKERAEFAREIQRKAGHKVLDIAGRVIADFAGTTVNDRIADGFVDQLKDLNEKTRKNLAAAADRSDAPALVESALTLDATARRKITRAIHEQTGTDIAVEYRENDSVLLGVRLIIDEQTVEWSAGRHLERLEDELDDLLKPGGAIGRRATAG